MASHPHSMVGVSAMSQVTCQHWQVQELSGCRVHGELIHQCLFDTQPREAFLQSNHTQEPVLSYIHPASQYKPRPTQELKHLRFPVPRAWPSTCEAETLHIHKKPPGHCYTQTSEVSELIWTLIGQVEEGSPFALWVRLTGWCSVQVWPMDRVCY